MITWRCKGISGLYYIKYFSAGIIISELTDLIDGE